MSIKYGTISDTETLSDGGTVTNVTVYHEGDISFKKRTYVERKRVNKNDTVTIQEVIIELINDPTKFDTSLLIDKSATGDAAGKYDLLITYSTIVR